MSKIAFVFSGQGAQAPGMGKELYDCSPAAKAVFDLADSIRPGTSQQCFEGTQEELNVTINTQPCLFACDLAAAKAAQERGIQPDCAAGFSLGEAAAVAFSGMPHRGGGLFHGVQTGGADERGGSEESGRYGGGDEAFSPAGGDALRAD